MDPLPVEPSPLPGLDRKPLTIGLLIGIIGNIAAIVVACIAIYAWVSSIRTDAHEANVATDHRVDVLQAQVDTRVGALKQAVEADEKNVDARFEAYKSQRDLIKSSRDAQVEGLKATIDGLSRRADATDAAVSDMKTTLARIAVGVDSIKERLDGRQRDSK